MYILVSIMIEFVGFLFLLLLDYFPFLLKWHFQWIGGIIMAMALVPIIYRLYRSSAKIVFDPPKKGKIPLLGLTRAGVVLTDWGKRIRRTSFIKAPNLGIVHDLGEGSVYRWGGKNFRFVIENVSFTVNPYKVNYAAKLKKAGFSGIDEVRKYLEGKLDDKRERELSTNLKNIQDMELMLYLMKKEDAKKKEEEKEIETKNEPEIKEFRPLEEVKEIEEQTKEKEKIYQTYNPRSGHWILVENGRFTDHNIHPFESVPIAEKSKKYLRERI